MPIIKKHQTAIDMAMQYAGAAEVAFDVALQNDICLTDELVVGNELNVNEVTNQRVVRFFSNNKEIDCITYRDAANPQLQEGIGFWAIGQDFKVS